MKGDIARDESSGFWWMDDMNPRLLSNNMILPYLIGCWEAYFRQSFVSILKYADTIPENALKKARLSNADILNVIRKDDDLEYTVADGLSFQRPSVINENFKQLNSNIKRQTWLSEQYHRRNKSLIDSITMLVECRDMLVHSGYTDLTLFDKELKRVISDLTVAVDRVYNGFGEVYNFN